MAYRVRLEMFEGPLDLLLYLIQVNEIDIYDIPIAKITEEYLGCLATMQELDLEVAGEFLVLAATLIQIKSRMLIPAGEPDGEEVPEEDPRRELVERLLEYRRFKEAALGFDELESRQQLHYARRGDPSLPVAEGPLQVTLSELLCAFAAIMRRTPQAAALEITPETITVSERMVMLIDRLTRGSPLPFTALFEGAGTRSLLISTFLALLELLRRGLVRARQSEPDGEITVYLAMEASHGGDGHPT
ncbi:MAG: segregation/condensation protein A [Candidatus Methylomirabilis oxyfera]|nr:segregation/condensation protein A [Candidatus Methylomirabilis oxyfera]